MSFVVFFFQAEDVIREAHQGPEFRRVPFRSAVTINEPADPRIGSHCLKKGDLLFVSGQVSRHDGQVVGKEDPLEQSRQALRNVLVLVEAGGGTVDDILSLSIMLKDIRHRNATMQAPAEFFCDPGPTAPVVGGSDLAHEELLVELSAIAK